MIYCFNGVNIHFKQSKIGDGAVNVFLHGWGRCEKDFEKIAKQTGKNYLLVDLPPFGLSDKIKDWTIYTYSNMVLCLLRHLKINKCNLIGHSFGGRIAIIIAGMEKDLVEKLVLVSSAGMKPKRTLKHHIKVLKYKFRKKMGLSTKNYGSQDYKNLDDDMKKVFNSVVNSFLEENAKLITSKTLIIFGENDIETPIYMAKRLNKLISNSKLVLMENCGHFCFLERPILFCQYLTKFLREEVV